MVDKWNIINTCVYARRERARQKAYTRNEIRLLEWKEENNCKENKFIEKGIPPFFRW